MISVPSLCHTTTALSITVSGIADPCRVCAVKTTCHIPTIGAASSSRSSDLRAARINCGFPSCECQLTGLTRFVGRPHCATALGIMDETTTSAAAAGINLPRFNLMCFSSAGDSRLDPELNAKPAHTQCTAGKG